VRLFRVARAGSGLDEPPYGGVALDRVSGLAPPEPDRLARAVRRRELVLFQAFAAVRERAAGLSLTGLLLAGLLATGGAFGYRWWRGGPERLVAEGRFREASAAIEERAARLGPEAPSVLYLRGRLEVGRADADAGGKLDRGFQLWARALAKGSDPAVEALAAETRSPACSRRLLAARALVDARTERARKALEALARAEPPAGLSAMFDSNRCGAGDVAREGLDALGEVRAK